MTFGANDITVWLPLRQENRPYEGKEKDDLQTHEKAVCTPGVFFQTADWDIFPFFQATFKSVSQLWYLLLEEKWYWPLHRPEFLTVFTQ